MLVGNLGLGFEAGDIYNGAAAVAVENYRFSELDAEVNDVAEKTFSKTKGYGLASGILPVMISDKNEIEVILGTKKGCYVTFSGKASKEDFEQAKEMKVSVLTVIAGREASEELLGVTGEQNEITSIINKEGELVINSGYIAAKASGFPRGAFMVPVFAFPVTTPSAEVIEKFSVAASVAEKEGKQLEISKIYAVSLNTLIASLAAARIVQTEAYGACFSSDFIDRQKAEENAKAAGQPAPNFDINVDGISMKEFVGRTVLEGLSIINKVGQSMLSARAVA